MAQTYTKLSPRGQALLRQMKDEFQISNDNALWMLLSVLDYHHRLYDEIPTQITTASHNLNQVITFMQARFHAIQIALGPELRKSADTSAVDAVTTELAPYKAELEQFLKLLKTAAFQNQLYVLLRREMLSSATIISDQMGTASRDTLLEKSQRHIQQLDTFFLTMTTTRLAIAIAGILIVMVSFLVFDSLSWRGLITTFTKANAASGYRQREAAFYAQLDHKSRIAFQRQNARFSPETRLNFPHP